MNLITKAKLIATLSLLWLAILNVHSQSARGNYNFLDFNQKPYYFGITLAYNNSNFKVFQSKDFILNDSINVVESVTGPGFNLGIVTNLKIGENFDIRFLPTLSFGERNINYAPTRIDRRPFARRVESVFVEMPFQARYKSAPFHDTRLFVVAGVKYSFDVASDSRSRQAETLVKIAPNDFAFEIGAGAQMFLPYFIFSPEIKFSHGFNNILIFDKNLEESSIIDKVLSRTFTLSFHFEG
ncbi:MAG: PorT family protein [Saprospiraceae bacterium]|nr:PorT family protein [Saprospiraceae bacterium]MCF8249345.1 PorT family protein [Saprospiraceae bacterium]MCF8311378.1 PorT family protein [Saprospiraceae bacterium]MCF8439964.1 PorT family protein [Saprospiraceae bacterium]